MRPLVALLLMLSSLSALASGPYTAFTYGDPLAVNNGPSSNPVISVRTVSGVMGLPLSNTYYPVPIAPTIASGNVGTAYSETFAVSGGVGPYTWICTDPANLPPGLAFSAGVLSGTPATAGTYAFHIQVTDVNGNSNTQPFTVVVAAPAACGNTGFVC